MEFRKYLSDQIIQGMKQILWCYVIILSCFSCNGISENRFLQSEVIQLSSPRISIDSFFFTGACKVDIETPLAESEVRIYQNDATDEYETYTSSLSLKESSTIYVQATHPDYLSSDKVAVQAIQIKDYLSFSDINYSTPYSEQYSGQGPESLSDKRKGSLDFKDGNWLGFQSDTLGIKLSSKLAKEINNVKISMLENQSAWIFAPTKIEVYDNYKLIGIHQNDKAPIRNDGGFHIVSIPLQRAESNVIIIKVITLSSIPEWHDGFGQKPWLFIDEIILN